MKKLSVLVMLVASIALVAACDKKEGGETPKKEGAAAAPADNPKAKALEEAWGKSADCQLLEKCCEKIPDDSKAMLGPFCDTIKKLKDFGTQAKNSVDVAWQNKDCSNRAKALAGMFPADKAPENCKKK